MSELPVHARLLAETAWLRSLARRLVGGELATDLEQDVAVAALQRPEQAATGRSWFAAVAHNLATSLRRRRAAEQRRLGALPLPDGVPSPAELVATAELQQRAVAAVLALPPAYRDTILMRFLQGLSLQATAAAMGVPEETVRTRQKRALARLREQLAPRRERRRGAALLASLAAWSAVVNAKVVVAGVAVLMVAVLATVPFRPSAGPTSSDAMAPGVAAARGVVADATPIGDGTVAGGPLAGEDGARRIVAGAPPEASAARLTVRLTWADSRAPAAGVVVLCRARSESGRVGFADAAGEVRFAPLPAGEYSVITLDWNSETTTLAAGEERTIAHSLPRGSAVTGVVLGPDDRPVADAEILVSSAGTVPQWLLPAARSDLHGRFDLFGLRSGALVGARHERFGTSPFCMLRSHPPADASATPMTLRLPGSGATIRGQVVDERGAAVGAAFVQLGEYIGNLHADAKGTLSQDPPATLETTDADGRFAAGALPLGALRVSVYRRGLAPHREVVHLEAAAVQELTVTLHPGAALIGRVLDAGGQVVAGTAVERRTACEYPERRQCDADVEGRFRFDDLPPGENLFEIAAPGFPRQRRSFVFTGSEAQQWDVVLQRGAAIHCRLVDHASAPLAGWWLRLRGSDRGYKTDDDGRCLIPEADAASNTLVVRESWGPGPEVLRVEHVVPGEQEQTFVVGPEHRASAWLRGHTVDAGGAALADAEIELVQDGWPVLLSEQNVRSGADGAFAVGPLPPGRYELQPAHRDCVFAAVAVVLQPNEQRDLGPLRGAEASRLVVKLTGDATAIARTTVVLVAGDRTLGSAGEGAERTFARVFPMRYRIALRGRDQDLDCGELDLAPGSEVVREIAVR